MRAILTCLGDLKMRMRLVSSLLGLGLIAMVAGCESNGNGDISDANMPLAEPVQIVEHYAGDQAQNLQMQTRRVIRTAAEFEQLDAPGLQEVEVDWDTQDLILVAMGMRSTGGYWAQITAAQVEGDTLYVQGVVNRPSADAMTTQALTYPWAAAVIPNVDVQRVQWDLMNVEGKTPGM